MVSGSVGSVVLEVVMGSVGQAVVEMVMGSWKELGVLSLGQLGSQLQK